MFIIFTQCDDSYCPFLKFFLVYGIVNNYTYYSRTLFCWIPSQSVSSSLHVCPESVLKKKFLYFSIIVLIILGAGVLLLIIIIIICIAFRTKSTKVK